MCPSLVFEIYPVTRSSVGSCGGAGKARLGPRDTGEWSWSHVGQSRCKKVTGSKSSNGDKGSGWVIVRLASSCQALCAWLGSGPAFRVVTVKSERLQAGCGMQWYVFYYCCCCYFYLFDPFLFIQCAGVRGGQRTALGNWFFLSPVGF